MESPCRQGQHSQCDSNRGGFWLLLKGLLFCVLALEVPEDRQLLTSYRKSGKPHRTRALTHYQSLSCSSFIEKVPHCQDGFALVGGPLLSDGASDRTGAYINVVVQELHGESCVLNIVDTGRPSRRLIFLRRS